MKMKEQHETQIRQYLFNHHALYYIHIKPQITDEYNEIIVYKNPIYRSLQRASTSQQIRLAFLSRWLYEIDTVVEWLQRAPFMDLVTQHGSSGSSLLI